MPTRKELESAWEVHDHTEPEPDCKDKYPKLWNDKLEGHSRFNPACQKWVSEWAKLNPVARIPGPQSKKVPLEKAFCTGCKKRMKEEFMYEVEETGDLVCSDKCRDRVLSKLTAKIEKMSIVEKDHTDNKSCKYGCIKSTAEKCKACDDKICVERVADYVIPPSAPVTIESVSLPSVRAESPPNPEVK